MTSRQRQLTAMRRGQPDRVPVFVRGVSPDDCEWAASRHPSFAPLMGAVREHGDLRRGVAIGGGTFLTAAEVPVSEQREPAGDWIIVTTTDHTPGGDLVSRRRESPQGYPGMELEFPVKTEQDAERVLSVPYHPPQPPAEQWLAASQAMGERGLVLVEFSDPIAFAHAMLGSSRLAEWSITRRPLLRRLVRFAVERLEDIIQRWLADARVIEPVFAASGQEFALPPLMSPRDFREFCIEAEQPLARLIHDRGGLLHIHCHGAMNGVIEQLVELGADCLHPVEPPPMGDLTLAEAKARVGRDLCLEGNIQIGDLLSLDTQELVAVVERALRDGMPGGGFILAPTASPYPPVLSDRARDNYLAMIETAVRLGAYG